MVNLERLKTVNLYEKKDPVRDLWRNVLIVGIEEMWFHHEDFKLICEFAQLEHSIVKKKVFKAIEKLKEKYEKRETSMPTMSGEWLHKDKEISGRSKRWNSSMSNV